MHTADHLGSHRNHHQLMFTIPSSVATCIRTLAFFSISLLLLFAFLILTSISNPPNPLSWIHWQYPSSFFGLPAAAASETPSLPTPMYPTFSNPKMQKAVAKLVKELDQESASRGGRPRDKKMWRMEAELAQARRLVKDAILKSRNSPPLALDNDFVPQGEIYRHAYVFQRSYMLMERTLKIYVYEEGELPLFHYGPTNHVYTSEGVFIGQFEYDTRFRTRNPDEAHVYFLPFSVSMIIEHLFDPVVRDKGVLDHVVNDYVRVVSTKYPYWNRSLGADHFMLACHDWGPRATWYNHHLYFGSMRALCNANTSEFFNPRKDFSIPELDTNPKIVTDEQPSNHTTLAFFAGGIHGHIRGALFHHWQDKDKDIVVTTSVPKNSTVSYEEMMQRSKYCLCPSGYNVATQRVTEAIYAGCVPVLINEDFVPPFSEVLNWDKFSVRVAPSELPELKWILEGIGREEYEALRRGVRQVQRHFVVNDPPKRYDVFHMVVHSLWLRRLNLRIHA